MKSSKRLRVLQVGKFYPPHMGGIETHLQVLCQELKHHVDVEVLVANDGRQDEESWDDGVKVTRLGTLFSLSTAPVCPRLVRKIRESKADIVHLHLPHPTAVLAYLASGHKGKLVVTYHSDIVRQKHLGRAFEPFLHRCLKRCAAIIATSPKYLETSSVLSLYRERCRIIPYGIPLQQFMECDPAEVVRIQEQYGPRIIISVGRLIYYKGFEYLIQAMRDVQGHLLIVGDGPLRPSLEDLARRSGVAHRVTFLGEIQNQDVTPFYHAANLFALASIARSEAFGIVQLEAMACGKPVVNTSLDSGVPYVSLAGITGLTVPPADPPALAQAINSLLDNSALQEAYGMAAKERVKQEFSKEVMLQRVLQLYQDVAGAPARQKEEMPMAAPSINNPLNESII